MAAGDGQGRSQGFLADLVARTLKAGADAADAVEIRSVSVSHGLRVGEIEKLERSEERQIGIRALVGRQQAVVASTDSSERIPADLIERVVAMARNVPEDAFCGLAEPGQIITEIPTDLEIDAAGEPDAALILERARICEGAARGVEGITNSEGAESYWGRTEVALSASNGFSGAYTTSQQGFGVAVVAGDGMAMERDYETANAVFGEDLEDPAEIGRTAGERAVRRLKPRKIDSAQLPVVYDPRVASGLVGHLASAVNGSAVARGTSFLKDSMGGKIFAETCTIIDDPLRRRGLGSRPVDAEGLACVSMPLVKDGILRNWILDLSSARQLDCPSTGRASRSVSGPPFPEPTNLYMEPGQISPRELMADIAEGFYVTELMGFGVDPVTGDYSRGASGFWIENGTCTFPVSELTVAGNLKDMFLNTTPADDLKFRRRTNAPTLRVEGMTVAGN